MSDQLTSRMTCKGRYILFLHIHPEKEDHMDLMFEDISTGNLICYNHPEAFSIFPAESVWTFYGLKGLHYLEHSGDMRSGFGALNPVETGTFVITRNRSDNQKKILILKTVNTTRQFRILHDSDRFIVLLNFDSVK